MPSTPQPIHSTSNRLLNSTLLTLITLLTVGGNPLAYGHDDLPQPKAKHELKISGNVAGMIHVHPDHRPVVGEITQIWIALSQRGGKTIPLSGCDCRMELHNLSNSAPTLRPILLPISLEGYTDVPSATLRFTQQGRYRLQLTGKPQRGYSFTPFTLEFEVNVAGN
ncbi:MAG: hypothetical protein ACK456_10660 [Pseudanabaenaceae cyanobacterium]|jgi:hypothetical protein